MADTLYFPDGTMEVVLGNPEDVLKRIVEERLGRDCTNLLQSILDDYTFTDNQKGDDYESISEGYFIQLHDVCEELEDILTLFEATRLNKAAVKKRLQAIRDSLHKQL